MATPVYAVDRVASQDCTLGNAFIPQGTCLIMFLLNVHHHDQYWSNPNEFCPERFSQESTSRHPFSFIPFSAGDRNCIGQKFAIQEALVVLTILMQKFQVQTNEEEYKLEYVLALSPSGLKMKFIPRYNPNKA